MNRRLVFGLLSPSIKPRCDSRWRKLQNYFRRPFSSEPKSFDPYKVLGVEPGSSFDTIRDQYMKLSKKYHPDYNPGNEEAEEKFITLNKAYKALVENVEKRQDPGSNSTESIKKAYDFTVEPLGIETEKAKPASFSKPLLASVICGIVAIVFINIFKNAVENVTSILQGRMSEKSIREQEKDIIEETRLAIIEYSRQKEKLTQLYETASKSR